MNFRTLRATCLAVACVTLPATGLAQAVSGTLLGTVTDASGAAVPNARITITATDTGQVQKFTSNESGNYSVPGLQPGRYTVTVEAPGFKRETHSNIDLTSNSSTRVDAALATGSVSEEVTISTAPPVLQTDRADISTKIERQAVADLPLGTNRNFQSLLNLVPGTTPATFQHSQFFNAQSALQTQANGIPRMGNLYQIEGIDDDERTGLLQIIIPPAEAIQSVDVSTNNFDAELGRAIGAVTNVSLRSGTNAVHGSAFEFIQNNAVNARSYFGGPLGHLAYNYFGGSLGGPIIKDRLFLFGDYLRTTDRERVNNVLTIVPQQFYTDNGNGFIDLSAPLNAGRGQVYDPATGNPDGTGRRPFAGNLIPINRINPVSLAFLRGLPAPNQNTTNLAAPTNNYNVNLPFSKDTNSYDLKADYTITQKDHLSGRFSWQRANTFQAPAFGSFLGGPAGGGGFQATGVQTAYSTGANLEHSFSNTLFTEIRVGVAHLRNNAQPSDYGSNDATTVGIPGVNIAGSPFTSGQVAITIPNFGQASQSYLLFGYSPSLPWIRGEANIDFVNNWTKTLKNHSIKFGGDVRRVRDDLLQDQTFSPRGAYTFGENQTSIPGASTNVANDIASFLLDVPSQAGRDLNTFFPAYRQTWVFGYVTDKWQVNQKLTLDLGVRWEFYPPPTPKVASGFSNYDFANNQLQLAGVGNVPADLGLKTRYNYFAPRTGLSYRASDNTVVRMGFGMSYLPFPDNTYAYNYPVRANNSFNPATTYGPAVLPDGTTPATFQAGFPAPVAVPIPGNGIINVSANKTLNSSNFTIIPTNFYNPYVMSWNVAVQQSLPYDMSMTMAYVANHGVHMPVAQNLNLPSSLGGGVASEPQNIAYGRTASSTAQFLGFSSNYQSLQAQLNKRFSHGLGFTTAFTWDKALNYQSGDDGGLLFFAELRRNYARADFDRKFNFENSFTLELPAGRGHKYFNSGAGQFLAGGWKLSGILSLVSGQPFTVNANGGALNTPGETQTANLVKPYAKVPGHNANGIAYFDPTSFSQPSGNGVTGNTQRNQFIGPGYVQDNLSIFKQFPLFREANLETRFEAFQLSNTPQFANPNSGTISSGNFGYISSTLGSGQGSVNGVGGGRSLQASVKLQF
ncbi:MAG: TonB-dependent receptor domain-containing protein [Janthinobacterium lividum]